MIIALMYYEGDLELAMSLARLLADLEPAFRGDVVLSLVSQPGTPRPDLVDRTVRHCKRKFPVDEVVSPLGATGHPAGCTALWTGTVQHYFDKYQKIGKPDDLGCHDAIFTLDAGDGVPLHRNWIDLVKREHVHTLLSGGLITGTPYFIGTCPLHINPNAVFQFDVFAETKLLTDIPHHDGTLATHFDIYHREEMLANASPSSIVRTDWHGDGQNATRELLLDLSTEAVWLHGYKDPDLHWIAREHLFRNPPSPTIRHYTPQQLHTQEIVYKDFEEARRCEHLLSEEMKKIQEGCP